MLGSHQTRNLSDVFPSQLRDRYVQLSPAVSCQAAELQLSGHSGAPAQPPPAARPSNPEVKAKATLGCQQSTLLFLPPTIWVSASEPSIRAANDPSVFIITEKAPTMAFSWLIAPTSIFTFNTQLTLYAKQACTPQ